jgi:hypothetical protein
MTKDQKGQALIESLIVFQTTVLIVSFVFFSMGSAWSFFWTEYQLQEAVLCLSDEMAWVCQQTYLRKIKKGVSFVRTQNFRIEKKRDHLYGTIEIYSLLSKKISYRFEKTVRWPLR